MMKLRRMGLILSPFGEVLFRQEARRSRRRSIQQPEQPEGKFRAVRILDVVGEDI